MTIKVMLVDSDTQRGAVLEHALRDAGHEVVRCALAGLDLLAEVKKVAADVILIDMEVPDRDVLESMGTITREYPRPIVMYVDQSDAEATRRAVKAGVSAYIVNDMNPERVKPILEVAIARFNEYQALRRELDEARNSLQERKLIERAKGLLMKKRGMDEETAYQSLRKLAMDRNQRLADVARMVLDLAHLLD